jgi:hypothetical protein
VGKIGSGKKKKVEPVNAHYHRLDVLAEFEKVSSSNTLWLWTLADSIHGAALWLCGFLMASSLKDSDAADCRLSEAVRLTRAEARTGSTFGSFLPPPLM